MTSEKHMMVSVIMLAYNHEKYIAQAIESVVNQQTNFPFELIIGEDCSTDKTADIISDYAKKFPNIITVLSSESNVGITANETRCLEHALGKYICYCEADDFWCKDSKLQMQVDFLEKNPDFGLVHGDVNHYFESTNTTEKDVNKSQNSTIPSGDIYEFLMLPSHSIKTMTVCYRRSVFDNYYFQNQEIRAKKWFLVDISIWLMIAMHSKIHYLDETLATYRLLNESMSRSKNPHKIYEFHQMISEIRHYFLAKKSVSNETKKQIEQESAKSLFYDSYNLKNKKLIRDANLQLMKSDYSLSFKEKFMYYKTKFLT